ncbi:MAG: hypothetical protein HY689_08530, partial [Chloroflexi bacterium]|nr:hypothetical protein [Chloroflexota bacterium]
MRTRSSPPIVTQPAPSAPSAREQGAEAHGWLHPEEGWTSLVLVGLVIGATLWAVEDARWVRDMPPLELLALVAIGLGFLLAKIRLPAVFLHPVSVVVGTIALIWATASISDGENAAQRLTDLAVRMYRWWEVASSGGISNDPVPFVFQVVALDWVIAYLSAWFVFRSQHAWLAVVPSGIALLINLTYLPGRFTSYFLLYLIASMLLVSRLHLVRQQRRWRQLGVTAPATVGVSYLSHALVVAVLVVSLAWQVPIASASASVSDVWERVSGPWREFEREFDRLFASVGSGRAVPVHGFGKALPFRGAISLGHFGLPGAANAEQGAVMQVQAEQPGYWRAAAYDTYTGQGWTSSARETALMPREVRRGTEGDLARREATITVEVLSPIDVLFSLGIPLSTDARAVAEVPAPAAYTVYLTEPGRNRGLPADLRRSAEDLRDQLRSADRLYDQG